MHISEGVLSAPVLMAGAVLTFTGVGIGLKKTDFEKIPEVAVLTSAFFVATLIHVPIGPSSAHLILNGLMGVLLGWSVFPAILVGLTLQAIFFQFGGFTSLGVNAFNMAFPALISFWMFRILVLSGKPSMFIYSGFFCGIIGVLGGSFLVALSLITTGEAFLPVAKLMVVVHIPVMLIEGIITAIAVGFLKRVKPELLKGD